jgi:O-antigen/teichoic acid export membrane protein
MVTAKFLGPAGMAVVGNLRNFLSAIDTYATLGFSNGVIKYTAEHDKEEEKLNSIFSTVFFTLLSVILVISIALFFLSGYWNEWIFGATGQYAWVFRVLAFALPWYAGNIIVLAVLNGLGNYKQVIYLNLWGNIAGVAASALLIWKFGIEGAFLGLVLYPAFLFFFSFYLMWRRFPGLSFLQLKYFEPRILKGMLSYSIMSFVTAIMAPVVYIAIRNKLMNDFSPAEAGYYEAINRIASFYLMFVTTLLTVWFLPQLSAAKTGTETKEVFKSYYKFVVPVFALGLVLVYFLRYFIITVLLSDEFLPMENLFVWQLLGDFFKACSLILGFQLVAKKKTMVFIVLELLSFIILYASSIQLIDDYGSEGAVMGHAATHLGLLTMLAGYFTFRLQADK